MKLIKGLKLRKKLVGEIAKLKQQIIEKNSYAEGAVDPEKFNVNEMYAKLLEKTEELLGLKYIISEANREIQAKIYSLSELKSLLSFWNTVPVTEGIQRVGYSETRDVQYLAQVDEISRDKIIEEFQKKIDALQEEIDTYNYTTDIPWGDAMEDIQEEVKE